MMPKTMLFVALALFYCTSAVASDPAGTGLDPAGTGLDPEEIQRQKEKIARQMAEGIQNNVELRHILIKKQMDENDLAGAMQQYRHIIRIQTNIFGAESPEVKAAEKQAEAHLKLLLAHEKVEFQALSDTTSTSEREIIVKKLFEADNILVKQFLAQQYTVLGDNSGAARLYKDIAVAQSQRYGVNSPEHVDALNLASRHEEL